MLDPRSNSSLDRRVRLLGAVGYLYLSAVTTVLTALAGLAMFSGRPGLAVLPGLLLWMVVGSLLDAASAPEGVPVSRDEHPRLFRAIDRARGVLRAPPVDVVLLTAELNASVTELPALGIVGPPRRWLVIGLPLLHTLSEDELAAILAHEFAHLAKGDVAQVRWVARVARGWEMLVIRLQAGRSWAGPLLVPFVRWYLPRLETLLAEGSRSAELRADRLAGKAAGAAGMARALVRMEAARYREQTDFHPALLRGTAEADAPPEDAFARRLSMLGSAWDRDAAVRALDILLRFRTVEQHSHPSLADRLEALGEVRPADEWAESLATAVLPAAATLLDGDAAGLASAVRGGWDEALGALWRQARADALTARTAGEGSDAEIAWARARWAAACEPPARAIPALRAVLVANPRHDEAALRLGLLLAENGTEREMDAGAALLERVADTESALALEAAEALQAHYTRTGGLAAAARSRRRVLALRDAAVRSLRESSILRARDTIRPASLTGPPRDALVAELQARPRVKRAFLVEKRTRRMADVPEMVLAWEPAVPWYAPSFGSANHTISQELLALLPAPAGADRLVMVLDMPSRVRRRLRRLDGAEVFRRGTGAMPRSPAPAQWRAGTLRDRIGPLHLAFGSAMALAAGAMLFDYASRTLPAWYPGPSLEQLREEAAARPDDARTLERLGMALAERERWVPAESAFAEVVAADSTSVTGFYMLGWVRMRDGRCDEALDAFRRALLLEVDHLGADHSLGFCLFREGEWTQAEMVLRSVVERAPEYPGAHADLGRVLLAQLRTDEADSAFRRTLQLDPRNREARHGAAMVQMRRGDLEGAQAALSRLARDHPEAWLYGDLGHVAHLAGDHPAAAAAFAAAERIDPRYFDAEPYQAGMWKASREGRTFDPEAEL